MEYKYPTPVSEAFRKILPMLDGIFEEIDPGLVEDSEDDDMTGLDPLATAGAKDDLQDIDDDTNEELAHELLQTIDDIIKCKTQVFPDLALKYW